MVARGLRCGYPRQQSAAGSAETGLDAYLVGFRMVCEGQFVDGPEREEDWPYHNVLEAIRDGWRLIRFPNMALCFDENQTYGLGF